MFCVQDDNDASQDLDLNVLSAQEPTTQRILWTEDYREREIHHSFHE